MNDAHKRAVLVIAMSRIGTALVVATALSDAVEASSLDEPAEGRAFTIRNPGLPPIPHIKLERKRGFSPKMQRKGWKP